VDQGTAISKEREQSRVGFQFPSNLDPLAQIEETIGFSRMESQSRPNLDPLPQIEETIGFSRMESQFQPNQLWQQSTGQN